ncbi:MAG: mannosyltransferase family protein [bacterium]|nr:mannosyltransferase family protein [bacterium]
MKDFKEVLIIFVVWFFAINIFALLASNRLNLQGDTAYTWIDPTKFSQNQTWNPITLHAKWDSFWYLDVAQNGYSFQGENKLSNIAFFPLYPLLTRAISPIFNNNLILSGWFLSTFFLFLAVVYLYKLATEFHKNINPKLAIIFLLIFPTSFFLNAVYAESLFLFLATASFYYALKKNYFLAGIIGFFASLTRVTGILLFLPLLWEYFSNFGFRRVFNLKLASLFLVPLGTIVFSLYHYLKFGDLLLYFKVSSWWGRSFALNKDHFLLLTNSSIVNFALDSLLVIFALIASYFIFKKLRASYGIYSLSAILLPLSTGTLMSVNRYILMIFPLYLLLASIKNRNLQQTIIFASILLLAMNITLFSTNYWAG